MQPTRAPTTCCAAADALVPDGAPSGADAAAPLRDALLYLRARIGVPRDMSYPAARQLRAHLTALLEALPEGG